MFISIPLTLVAIYSSHANLMISVLNLNDMIPFPNLDTPLYNFGTNCLCIAVMLLIGKKGELVIAARKPL